MTKNVITGNIGIWGRWCILILFFLLCGCEEEYTEVYFKITCEGETNPGTFSGYYCLDGGDDVLLDFEQQDSYSYTYTSPKLENFSYLEIFAERDYYDGRISIRVYENGIKVLSSTLTADDDEDDSSTDYLEIDYEYEEYLEDDTESSD